LPRQQFYEPLIQEDAAQMEIRGFAVTIGGTYVLLDDIVTALREYAHALSEAEQAALIHEVATWLQAGDRRLPEREEIPPVGNGAVNPSELTPDVERVEIFPVETARGRRWHARSIDTSGNVMKATAGSFDKTYVERDARDRWPNTPLYELQDENERSMTKERGKRGYAHELWSGLHA
jgi:hypothetical protein